MCFQKNPFVSEVSSVYVNIDTVYELDETNLPERKLDEKRPAKVKVKQPHYKGKEERTYLNLNIIYINNNVCLGRIGKYCAADFMDVLEEQMEKHYAIDDVVLAITRGYLLSGNHRHACKEWIRINEPKEYENPNHRPFWNGTYAQLYVGLSPCQARHMSYIDNERSKTQSEDTAASKIEVIRKLYNFPE